MNVGGLVGFLGCWALLIYGMGPKNLGSFIDVPSILIVIGCSVTAILLAYPMDVLKAQPAVWKKAFFNDNLNVAETIKMLVAFADKARREGILSLEDQAQKIDNSFLKKGIQLAVDGTEPDLIRDILRTELVYMEERHKSNVGVIGFMKSLAPAMGMLGTLIGLILMLGNMSDPASLGPSMAVALITTLYGSIIANVICMPIENILKSKSSDEIMIKTLMLEGIMSLQSGDNPHIVEQKLLAFLDPASRSKASKEAK